MSPMTISAQVVNGRILPEQSVAALEGQRVIATLTVVPQDSANGKTAEPPPDKKNDEEFDPEPPPWLDIENDVYFPMKVPEIRLPIKRIVVERGEPHIVLPDPLPDD